MKQFVISSEVSSKNFSNDISLEKNCVQVVSSKDSLADFVLYTQKYLNDYVFPIVNINTDALIKVNPIDWIETEEYITHLFTRIRTEHKGYLVHYSNCSVVWYVEHGEIYRLCVKTIELNIDDCVLVSSLNTNQVHILNKKVSMKFLDNLWLVTQLYEKDQIDKHILNTEKEKTEHYNELWLNFYERECAEVDEVYVYNQLTRDEIKSLGHLFKNPPTLKKAKRKKFKQKLYDFNKFLCPVNYFFPKENLDYNDYDMNTGEVIEYTVQDYAEGKHKEDALLVTILRSEDDLTKLFKEKS